MAKRKNVDYQPEDILFPDQVIHQTELVSEMKKSYIANKNSFQPRKENNYTLFCDFNRVFLWGTNDKEEPVFGINVQSDV